MAIFVILKESFKKNLTSRYYNLYMRFSDLKKDITSILKNKQNNKDDKSVNLEKKELSDDEIDIDKKIIIDEKLVEKKDKAFDEKTFSDPSEKKIKEQTNYKEKNIIRFSDVDYEKTISFYSSTIKRFERILLNILDLSYLSVLDDLKYLSSSIYNEIENPYLTLMLTYLTPKDYIISHSINVAILSGLIAKNLNFSQDDAKNLILSAFCIDFGMPPYRNLYSEERVLTQHEKKIIEMHVQEGVEIVEKIFSFEPSLKDFVINIVKNSHERYDGTGYYNKTSDELDVYSQIVALSDFYEALTHPRPWRDAFEEAAAIDMITTGYRKKFLPSAVKGLISTIGVYPPGSFVKLSTGEIAQVLFINKDKIFRPFIKVVMDSSFNEISYSYLDLSEYPLTSIDTYVKSKDILKNNPDFKKKIDLARLWIEW